MGQPVDILFPTGIDRRFAFQSQPPFTTPDALNVRAEDTILQRMRGGSRARLAKAYPTLLGNGNPIRLLAECRSLNAGTATTFFDNFDTSPLPNPPWSAIGFNLLNMAGAFTPTGVPVIAASYAKVAGHAAGLPNTVRGAILDSQSPATGARRAVTLDTTLKDAIGEYCILMDMNNATPAETAAVELVAYYDPAGSQLFLYVNNVQVASAALAGGVPLTRLSLDIDPAGSILAFWSSPSSPDLSYSPAGYTPTGGRVGFAVRILSTNASLFVGCDWFRYDYTPTSAATPSRMLVAVSNGILYRENTVGAMNTLASQVPTIATDRLLVSTNRLQKLYIADYFKRASGTNASLSGGVLTDIAAGFIAAGVDANSDRLEILSGGNGTVGVYTIGGVTATTITIGGSESVASGVKYRIVRAPKVFNAADLTLAMMGIGTIGDQPPLGCALVAAWRDRLVFTGDPDNPHVAYFSKAGLVEGATAYAYAKDVPDSAFAYDPVRLAGSASIGDAVTAVIAHNNDTLLFAGERSLSIQRGDPTYGGSLDQVTRLVGIVGPFAWATTPEGSIVALSTDGIYNFIPGPEIAPEPVSPDKLPQELRGILIPNPNGSQAIGYDVQLAFSLTNYGIEIYLTPRTIGPTQHWFLDWRTKNFHKVSLNAAHEPTALCVHAVGGQGSPAAILGGRDGYLRRYQRSATTDDGSAVTDYVLYGPVALSGGNYLDGMLDEVIVQLAANSGAVRVYILIGRTAEDAYGSAPVELTEVAKPLTAGIKRTFRPQRRGNAAFIKLVGTGLPWAVEIVQIVRRALGKQRLGGSGPTAVPVDTARLTELQALSVPTIKIVYRPLRTELARPNWWSAFVRLTRSICIDARTVTATGIDTGLASAMTWAEAKALETAYSAQVCVFVPAYQPGGFGTYINTDASVTTGGGGDSDATHVANIAVKLGYIKTNYVDALGGTVRTVFLDTEVFAAQTNTVAHAAYNNALKLKFQQVYDAVVAAFPNCTYVNWFGLGAPGQNAAGNDLTPVSTTDSGPGGPFPWGQRWGMENWCVNHFDETDASPVGGYTAGGSVPFVEVANAKMTLGPILYRPWDYEGARRTMIEANRLYGPAGIWAALNRPIIPWMSLGAGYRATADVTNQPTGTVASYGAATYDTGQSYWYGIIFHDAFHATMMPKPVEVIFWESPNDPNYPAWMDHFVAFCRGAAT